MPDLNRLASLFRSLPHRHVETDDDVASDTNALGLDDPEAVDDDDDEEDFDDDAETEDDDEEFDLGLEGWI